MKIKIVGVERQDYKIDNGPEFNGRKIHFVDLETEKTGLVGCLVSTTKIADGSKLANERIDIGKEYTAYFNQNKVLDFIQPVLNGSK